MVKQLATEVVVIGGGIMGASTALFLRKRGIQVVVVERDLCGSRSSGVNFGGVRRQGRSLAMLPLSQRSHQHWGRLTELIGTEAEYERSGHFKIARSQADMESLVRYAEKTRDCGLDLQLLDGAELHKRFPVGGAKVVGGSFCPDDGQANPRLLSPAFATAAARAGAQVFEHSPVLDVAHNGQRFVVRTPEMEIRANVVVNAAGAWAGQFAEQCGEPVPMRIRPPAMGVTEPLPFFLHWSLGVEGGSIYCRQVRRGNVVFGGGPGLVLDDTRARNRHTTVWAQLPQLVELLPQLKNAQLIRTWSGNEGALPDHEPIISASSRQAGLYHAFGFAGGGFQLGPGVGDVMAELIAQGRSSTPIDAFRIDRFTDPACST
ncbi:MULTISPECIES: NAD(P)/FAD-dependent oxidoreductase [Comamonas]|jgi:sarcosine oxidase subunit beta|uniref:FAD-binding oxidoreductase n=1 Tax=Comamonas squillarum TaxID=2977320 RepID=A0ABY5ZW61_9BURK|nr:MULTISPECIES: FAD-binding oxidoreductase [Comamonas]UXC17559.1 FAD-binding oxidoreductase [Comamonas sp. PR12]